MSEKIIGMTAFQAQDVTKMVPHGDRLLVEKWEVEDAAFVPGPDGKQVKVMISRAQPNANNPRNPAPKFSDEEMQEIARGWILVRVVAFGDGHRLEIDQKVPMPFHVGEFLYIERLAQHHQEFSGKKYYMISQMDVLMHAPEVEKLVAMQNLPSLSPV